MRAIVCSSHLMVGHNKTTLLRVSYCSLPPRPLTPPHIQQKNARTVLQFECSVPQRSVYLRFGPQDGNFKRWGIAGVPYVIETCPWKSLWDLTSPLLALLPVWQGKWCTLSYAPAMRCCPHQGLRVTGPLEISRTMDQNNDFLFVS